MIVRGVYSKSEAVKSSVTRIIRQISQTQLVDDFLAFVSITDKIVLEEYSIVDAGKK